MYDAHGRYSSLEFAFSTKELRTVCENETQAINDYGDAIAGTLKRRLADLRAAKSIKDLVVGHPRVIGDGEYMIIDLCGGYHIMFKANHLKNPMLEDGQIDWTRVSRLKIIQVGSDIA